MRLGGWVDRGQVGGMGEEMAGAGLHGEPGHGKCGVDASLLN